MFNLLKLLVKSPMSFIMLDMDFVILFSIITAFNKFLAEAVRQHLRFDAKSRKITTHNFSKLF